MRRQPQGVANLQRDRSRWTVIFAPFKFFGRQARCKDRFQYETPEITERKPFFSQVSDLERSLDGPVFFNGANTLALPVTWFTLLVSSATLLRIPWIQPDLFRVLLTYSIFFNPLISRVSSYLIRKAPQTPQSAFPFGTSTNLAL